MIECNEDPTTTTKTSKLLVDENNYSNSTSLEQVDDGCVVKDDDAAAAMTTKKTDIEFAQGEAITTDADATHDQRHPSSDFPFLCGLSEPIDMSPSKFPVDLASFAAILATETTATATHGMSSLSCWMVSKSLAIQLAANFVVWIKILLLSSILVDSMTPRCTSNAQCKPGLFCFPLKLAGYTTDWPTESRGESICNDCLFANVIFNGNNETTTTTTSPQAEEFLQAGRDYCINDDPDRCDFLQANRGKYSYLSFIVLCCLCGMFGRMIYLDLHKLHLQQRLYEYRFELMKMTQQQQQTGKIGVLLVYLTGAINWFAYVSRAYILPSWMFTGAALLLTTWAPTTRNLLIVPIQIGLIANFDMVLEFVFLRQSHKEYTKNAARALELQQSSSSPSSRVITKDKVLAVLIRLYSFGLAVQIPIFVLMAESIYPYVSFVTNAVGQNNPKYSFPIPVPCNDIIAAGIYFPLLLSVPMTLLIGPVANRYQCCTALHVLGYVSTTVFVLYSCFLVREIITYLQFQSF